MLTPSQPESLNELCSVCLKKHTERMQVISSLSTLTSKKSRCPKHYSSTTFCSGTELGCRVRAGGGAEFSDARLGQVGSEVARGVCCCSSRERERYSANAGDCETGQSSRGAGQRRATFELSTQFLHCCDIAVVGGSRCKSTRCSREN